MAENCILGDNVTSFFSNLNWQLPLFHLALDNVIKRAGERTAGVEIFNGDEAGLIQAINFHFSGNTQGDEVLGLLAGGTDFTKNSELWFNKRDLEGQKSARKPTIITPVQLVNQIGFAEKFQSGLEGKVYFEYRYYDRAASYQHRKSFTQRTQTGIPDSLQSLFNTLYLEKRVAEPDINYLKATLVFPDFTPKQQQLRRLFSLSEDQKIYFCEIQPDGTVIIRGDDKRAKRYSVEFKRLDLAELESLLRFKTGWEAVSAESRFSLTTDQARFELGLGKLKDDYGNVLFSDALLPITDSHVTITHIQ